MSKVKTSHKLGYAISEIGVTGMVVFGSVYIFSYMTNTLGIPAVVAGTIFLGTKLFDAVTDPLVGYLSDKTKSRRPWILAGAFVMGPALAVAFYAPFSTETWHANAAWFSVFIMLSYLGLTLIGVPHGAMVAEMTEDYDERTSVITWRMWIATIGILMGAAGYALMTENFGNLSIEGYRNGLLLIFPLMIIPTVITYFATKNIPVIRQQRVDRGLIEGFKIVAGSKAFRVLAFSYILMVGMITAVAANLSAIIEYILREDQSFQPLLSAMLLFPTFLALPIWAYFAKYIEKPTGLLIGGAFYALGLGLIYTVSEGQITYFALILGMMGSAYAAYLIFPWSMLPDVISEAQNKHGGTLAGLFNGWWTTCQKFGIALGPFIAGLVLQFGGYEPSVNGQFVEQTPEAINAVRLAVSLVPAAIFIIGVLSILRYPLGRSDQTNISSAAQK